MSALIKLLQFIKQKKNEEHDYCFVKIGHPLSSNLFISQAKAMTSDEHSVQVIFDSKRAKNINKTLENVSVLGLQS